MKRAFPVLLVLAACSSKPLPVIASFTVNDANPEAGLPVTFTFSVTGANRGITLLPLPGAVTQSPVMVVPPAGTTTFTLRATNDSGVTARNLSVTVRDAVPLIIATTDASPGQSLPGTAVTLSWLTSGADHAAISGGEIVQPRDVAVVGSTVVHPAATTSYTLTAFNKPGRTPASITAKITARVFSPPSVSGFSANPSSILQGEAATLSWNGTGVSYSVSDGTTTFNLGPRRSLVVRPSQSTTYTLNASGPAGLLANPATTTVTVTPRPASTLAYTLPATSAPLQLVAEICSSPCTVITLKVVATSAVGRGVALNLPLDTTKVSFDPTTFSTSLAGAEPKAAMLGSGALQNTLVIGIALRGTGTAPAADIPLGPELARFKLALAPSAGVGVVFDGPALAAQPASAFKAIVQSASGRSGNAIAVGRLEAQ